MKNPKTKPVSRNARIYPCAFPGCKTMRSRMEGGAIFTVCDEHWAADIRSTPSPAREQARGTVNR